MLSVQRLAYYYSRYERDSCNHFFSSTCSFLAIVIMLSIVFYNIDFNMTIAALSQSLLLYYIDRKHLKFKLSFFFSFQCHHLLLQEAWSDGIEPEVIEFLTTVYELLVFGEILGPDGSILTPPASASSSSLDSQNGKNNSKKVGPGFGSMSQWSGPGRGTGPGGRSSDMSSSGSSGHNGKDAAMLSDLPRKVRVCVFVYLHVCM